MCLITMLRNNRERSKKEYNNNKFELAKVPVVWFILIYVGYLIAGTISKITRSRDVYSFSIDIVGMEWF